MKLPGIRFQLFGLIMLSLCVVYGFAALEITADEILGVGLSYGPLGRYYWPIIGPTGLWDSWVWVFTGLALLFLSIWVLGVSTGRQLALMGSKSSALAIPQIATVDPAGGKGGSTVPPPSVLPGQVARSEPPPNQPGERAEPAPPAPVVRKPLAAIPIKFEKDQ